MKKLILRLSAIMVIIVMLLTVSACNTGNVESEAINYGNDVIDEIVDDGDTVSMVGGDSANDSDKNSGSNSNESSGGALDKGGDTDKTSGGNSNKNPGSNSGGMTIDYSGKFENNFEVESNKKTSFLESVPDKLAGQEVSILTWWQPFEHEKKKMEKFTKETGIKIKWIYADSENYMQRLATLRAQGNSPDIACIGSDNFPNAILLDYFRPLSETKMDVSDKKVFDVDSMNNLKIGGEQYGVILKGTTYVNMGIIVYNADMFDKHGITAPAELWNAGKWNWDSFVQTGIDIRKAANVAAFSSAYHGYRFSQTAGEDAVKFDKNGKLVNNMKSDNYRSAFKFLAELMPTGKYGLFAEVGNDMYGNFLSGEYAMICTDTYALQNGERLGDSTFALGFVPMPCKTNNIVIPSSAQLWGFPTGSKHLEAATYALEYWHDPRYVETGHNLWLSDSVAGFVSWLWEQEKCFNISQGIINYSGEMDYYEYCDYVRSSAGKIDSYIDSQMSMVDANLKKIYEVADSLK